MTPRVVHGDDLAVAVQHANLCGYRTEDRAAERLAPIQLRGPELSDERVGEDVGEHSEARRRVLGPGSFLSKSHDAERAERRPSRMERDCNARAYPASCDRIAERGLGVRYLVDARVLQRPPHSNIVNNKLEIAFD